MHRAWRWCEGRSRACSGVTVNSRRRARSHRVRISFGRRRQRRRGRRATGVKQSAGGVEPATLVLTAARQLQCFDKEPERTDVAGHLMKLRWRVIGIRRCQCKAAQGGTRVLDGPHALVLIQHRQGAADLMQQRVDRGQGRIVGRCGKVGVEQFFYLPQVDLQLAGQCADGIALLGLTRHVVKPWGCRRWLFAGDNRQQPRRQGVGLAGKIFRQMADMAKGVFHEQQAAGHLQTKLIAGPAVGGRPGNAVELTQQLGQWQGAESGPGLTQCPHAGFKPGRCVLVSRSDAVPQILDLHQAGSGCRQRDRIDRHIPAPLEVGRHLAIERIRRTNRLQAGRRLRHPGNEKQGIPQHPVGQAGRAFRESADLQVNPGKQLLDD